jgi:hypothetical protein
MMMIDYCEQEFINRFGPRESTDDDETWEYWLNVWQDGWLKGEKEGDALNGACRAFAKEHVRVVQLTRELEGEVATEQEA